MYILGLATMGESAAALIRDGVVLAAVEEERFTRVKHEGRFPVASVRYCLSVEGISLSDVDHICVYWQPWRMGRRARLVMREVFQDTKSFWRKIRRGIGEFSLGNNHAGGGDPESTWGDLFRVRNILRRNFGPFRGEVHYVDHHMCHLASAYYCSPFDEAVMLTIDGGGEEASTTIYSCRGKDIKVLRSFFWPNSLGHFYSGMTGYLGFQMLDGEYKMMGLGPYGEPEFLEAIRSKYLITDAPGSYRLNTGFLDYHAALDGIFGPDAAAVLGPPRRGDDEVFGDRHAAIAASAQAAYEEVVMDLGRWAYEVSGGITNLCIAGGCGLNGTANGKLLREGPFEKVWIPPAPHDAGAAVGAALQYWHQDLGEARAYEMDTAYLGPDFTDAEIVSALEVGNLDPGRLLTDNEVLSSTVDIIEDGGVVAWFQGRMEFGPRALGNRSFLADPRDDGIRDAINTKIKKRELFRPFAPSVIEEERAEFFHSDQPLSFMNIVVDVRHEKRDVIPAVTHINGTARPQSVSRNQNPKYWSLLREFGDRTGVPVLLNTSFNIQEPVVCTPSDAVATFNRSKVDALVIGDRIIRQRER